MINFNKYLMLAAKTVLYTIAFYILCIFPWMELLESDYDYDQKKEQQIADHNKSFAITAKEREKDNNRLTPEEYFQAGIKARNNQEYTEADNLFDQAVAGYMSRGDKYLARNDFDEAITDYQEAIKINPYNIYLHFDLATAQSKAKQYKGLEDTLTKIWELQAIGGEMHRFYFLRAEGLFAEEKYDEALVQIDKAIEADSNHPEYLDFKIEILTKLNRLEEARELRL